MILNIKDGQMYTLLYSTGKLRKLVLFVEKTINTTLTMVGKTGSHMRIHNPSNTMLVLRKLWLKTRFPEEKALSRLENGDSVFGMLTTFLSVKEQKQQ
jgi:hypothetical protein